MRADEVSRNNQAGWDRRVEEQDIWTRPVSRDEVARARRGDWAVVLTPHIPVPRDWFGEIQGRDILCLASGGGQQGPILAAAGARVTVFDASERQLAQDQAVAARDGSLRELGGELSAVKEQNAGYREQVVSAYSKIKSDEQLADKARKAMAVALTLLDEQLRTANGAGSHEETP